MPSPVRLTEVGFAHRPDVPLLAGATLHLDGGWTAIVGPNGAGKTTLLRLLAGEWSPTTGTRSGPPRPSVHLCPQRCDERTEAIDAFAWGWAGPAAWDLQSRLQLDPAELDRWHTLSPGERKRWQVGAALCATPELLLLDEPTNHLDAGARELLIAALQRFDGVGVVVSHDRDLLRALATGVVRIRHGTTETFAGAWDDACAQWAIDRLELERRAEETQRQLKSAKRRLDDAHRRAESTARGLSTRTRMKSIRDNDARSSARKVLAQNAAKVAARRVTTEKARARRAVHAAEAVVVRTELGRDVAFGADRADRARLASLQVPEVRAGDHIVLTEVDVTIDRGDKIWIRGPNGAGKSTLVGALLASSTLPPERVVVVPQAIAAEEACALLQSVRELEPELRGRVLCAVAALGVAPGPLLASEQPSPGEARKLAIALGFGCGAWLLVLDEPSNHLDLPSVERLQAALQRFDGAVVLVTHDTELGAAVAEHTWRVEAGRVEARAY